MNRAPVGGPTVVGSAPIFREGDRARSGGAAQFSFDAGHPPEWNEGRVGNRTCEALSSPCSGAATAGVQLFYNGADELGAEVTGQTTTTCAGVSAGITPTQDCLAYDGNGEVTSLDFTEGATFNNQALTWSTATGSPSLAVWTEDSSGTPTHADIMYGPNGEPVEQVQGSTPDWYYQDLSGNTRALLGLSGGVDSTYSYDDYGNPLGGAGTGPQTPLQYQGLFTDTVVTGLVFMQARWYDPSSAQFMSQDPLVQQTLQPYAYAGDNPVNSSDPTGLCNNSHVTWNAHPKNGKPYWRGDRWKVKEGWGSDAKSVDTKPRKAGNGTAAAFLSTVEGMQKPPGTRHGIPFYDYKFSHKYTQKFIERLINTRYGGERYFWRVKGTISKKNFVNSNPTGPAGGRGSDGDSSFDLSSGGKTVKCELPYPTCDEKSPWDDALHDARNFIQNAHDGESVWVVGPALWDTWAHPSDSRPEIHPVARICPAKDDCSARISDANS